MNEGVILPGLGGFVTTYHPAEIHKDTHEFQPPSAIVGFDSRMIADNGLLVSHIAHKNKLSEDEARLMVNEYVGALQKELLEKGSVCIEAVGTLAKTSDGELTYKVAADANYCIQSFGLPSVEVPQPVKSTEMKPRTIPSPVVPVITRKKRKFPLAALISFLVLFAAGAIYFTGVFERYLKPLFLANEPSPLDSVENSDKIIFGQPVSADEDTSDREINQQLTSNSSKEKALYYQESDKAGPEQTQIQVHEVESPVAVPSGTQPPVAKVPAASPPVAQTGNYYIVAGSFLKPGNANRQKADLEKKGYSPFILQKNDDFFYVTLQSFDSKEAATAAMKKIAQDLDLSLWVLKK